MRASPRSKVDLYKNSTACKVLTSSLIMDMEAVTHALGWFAIWGDSQTTHAIIFTDFLWACYKNGKPRLTSDSVWHPPLKTPLDVCIVLDMLKLREMAMLQGSRQRDWQAEQLSQMACISDLKCWGAWDTGGYKAKHSTPSIRWWERHRLMKLLMIFLERKFIFICGGWMLLIMQGA